MSGAPRAWLLWWAASAALWLALSDSVQIPELVAAALGGAGAATGAVLVRARRETVARIRWVWALRGARACLGLVGDLPLLASVLWRRGILRRDERGAIVSSPFAATDPRDPVAAGDRAAAPVVGSLAPAAVVVDVDVEAGTILEHRLRP